MAWNWVNVVKDKEFLDWIFGLGAHLSICLFYGLYLYKQTEVIIYEIAFLIMRINVWGGGYFAVFASNTV